jgi:hypothetical protein
MTGSGRLTARPLGPSCGITTAAWHPPQEYRVTVAVRSTRISFVDPHLGHPGTSTLLARPGLRRQRPEHTGRDHPEGILREHEGDERRTQGGPGNEFPAARTASLLAGSVMSVGEKGQAVRARRHQTPSSTC